MIEVVLLIFLSLFGGLANGEEQHVTAKGHITCRGVLQTGIFVQMYDEDSIPFFDDDDLMGSTTSDVKGTFCVKGKTDEWTAIEPYIYIEHNCGYESTNEKGIFILEAPANRIKTSKPHGLDLWVVNIELLTSTAPIQKLPAHHHHHNSFHFNRSASHGEMIEFCTPHYVQYREVFEKLITKAEQKDGYELENEQANPTGEPSIEPSTKSIIGAEEKIQRLEQETNELQNKVNEDMQVVKNDQNALFETEEQEFDALQVLMKEEYEEDIKVSKKATQRQKERRERFEYLKQSITLKNEQAQRKHAEDRKRYEDRTRQEVPVRQQPPPVQPVPQVIPHSRPTNDPCQVRQVVTQNTTIELVEDPCDRRIR